MDAPPGKKFRRPPCRLSSHTFYGSAGGFLLITGGPFAV